MTIKKPALYGSSLWKSCDELQVQQLKLDKKTVSHYAKLDIDEIKERVMVDKWLCPA